VFLFVFAFSDVSEHACLAVRFKRDVDIDCRSEAYEEIFLQIDVDFSVLCQLTLRMGYLAVK